MSWSKGYVGGKAEMEDQIDKSDIPDAAKAALRAHLPAEDGHIWRLMANGHDDKGPNGADVLISFSLRKGEARPVEEPA
jgi:hypothetical protein